VVKQKVTHKRDPKLRDRHQTHGHTHTHTHICLHTQTLVGLVFFMNTLEWIETQSSSEVSAKKDILKNQCDSPCDRRCVCVCVCVCVCYSLPVCNGACCKNSRLCFVSNSPDPPLPLPRPPFPTASSLSSSVASSLRPSCPHCIMSLLAPLLLRIPSPLSSF